MIVCQRSIDLTVSDEISSGHRGAQAYRCRAERCAVSSADALLWWSVSVRGRGADRRRVGASLLAGLLIATEVACSSNPAPTQLPSGLDAAPAAPSTTKYGRLFAQIGEDGTVSKEIALQAFSMAIAPLPGVAIPDGDPPTALERMDGTFAIDWLMPYRDELTAEQRAAVDAALAPSADAVPLGDSGPGSSALSSALKAGVGPAVAAASPAVSEQVYDQALKDARTFFQGPAAMNRPLKASLSRVIFNPQHESKELTAYAYTSVTPNVEGGINCEFHVEPELAVIADVKSVQASMAHEMFHCFQDELLHDNGRTDAGMPLWIIEGQAAWAGEAALGPSNIGRGHWEYYLLTVDQSLFTRSYSAIGFYGHLQSVGISPWSVVDKMLLAADSDSAFTASGAPAPGFMDTWASGLFRDSTINGWWNEPGRWQTNAVTEPAHLIIGVGDTVTLSAKKVSNQIVRISATADVLEAQIKGHARSHGNIDIVGLDGRWLCTRESKVCECPPGQVLKDSRFFEAQGPEFPVGVSGDLTSAGGTLTGHGMDEFCKPGPSVAPAERPCKTGCGGSNGDPHLKTVDGSRYDLQAAGEYVMLRAPDRSVEIQARQEPRGDVATVNTALAARVNDHRVGFYMVDDGVPEVRIDGSVVPVDGISGVDLGPGASLAAYERGYQLDFPDGTTLWALSMGTWGINVLVLPSDSLRADGVGIIARVPSDTRFRIPALPDGSTLPAPANHDERFQSLYGTFAPAWRVTEADTLFDYDEAQTTDSFTVADFPPPTAPLDVSELDPNDFSAAQLTCGAVTDPDLAEQCAFDVVITGAEEFVSLYLVSDQLETQGTSTLSEPPPTLSAPETPAPPQTPRPTGGPLPSDINFVLDHVVGLSSRVVGPNGHLYALAITQKAAFGDVRYVLLDIDPATGEIVNQADSHGPGMLAWAAESLWAGEFNRPEVGTCQISRLDPDTLTEQASVATVCADQGLTTLTSVGDAVWFIDNTGAAADGTGQHLRRIDPGTNAIDASSAGNLTLPVAVQFINVVGSGTLWTATGEGLIFGNRATGLYRLLDGSETFDPLGTPGIGNEWYAAADGVWTTTNTGQSGGLFSEASFYNGGDQPVQTVGYDGYLSGADDNAVFVEYQEDDTVAPSLVRYPADGSGPAVVAQGGYAQNSFGGQTTLGYHDALINPLVFNGLFGVKSWTVPSASEETMQQLLVQALQLP
jgi:hypothetical protein